ncbi:hypothetical protein LOD99_12625 [Oopsacas minuta]|uniref:Protein Red n=1 Tax=Oopsacas minuta TaxID=111878 RepID=A0AAV7JDG1_9METZ|nr:hypothetical protein LOD99_12625 [Oopsacas minuta]
MMKFGSERYANPEAPDGFTAGIGGDFSGRLDIENTPSQLSNSDFRKLLMTPRDPTTVKIVKPVTDRRQEQMKLREAAERRRKKKVFYAKLRKEEVERQAEMDAKYRDRAKERRDGKNPDYEHTEPGSLNSGSYRAVGPTARDISINAELRKQAIQESKYLGGDMEHTHLVKGLDYALLQKVRSEISTREREKKVLQTEQEKIEKTDESKITSAIAKNVYRILFQYKPPEKNEFFVAGRMAYAISIEDETPEDSDVPITLIRSKSELPSSARSKGISVASGSGEMDMFVINKLTQVLSYLRQDVRSYNKKLKRKDRLNPVIKEGTISTIPPPLPALPENNPPPLPPPPPPLPPPTATSTEQDIYADVGDYVCDKSKKYKYSNKGTYAECYPGGREFTDALGDSDDEADYSKMDNGTKKGPITRWDFANEEAYSDYQLQREAMPKAAFQYGVKMSDGRRTRKSAGRPPVDKHKSKIDRDFNKIMKIIRDKD